MKNRRKKNILFIVILLVAFLGIGYAYLNTNLKITGANGIEGNNWDVHWDNVQVTSGSVSGDQVTTAPTISNDGTAITYHIRLKEPGEFYEFTVNAVNAGTVDAMIDTITKKVNNSDTIPPYINYTIKYSNGVEIGDHQLLSANSTETYKVRVEYRTDIDPSVLPTTAQSLSLTFGISYVQADSYAASKDYIFLTVSPTGLVWNATLPSSNTYYSSALSAINSWEHNYFIRAKINNNIVEYTEIGYIMKGKIKYITSANTTYESNLEKINNEFGESNCGIGYNGSKQYYKCTNNNYTVEIYDNGKIDFYSHTSESGSIFPCFISVPSSGNKFSGCWND